MQLTQTPDFPTIAQNSANHTHTHTRTHARTLSRSRNRPRVVESMTCGGYHTFLATTTVVAVDLDRRHVRVT